MRFPWSRESKAGTDAAADVGQDGPFTIDQDWWEGQGYVRAIWAILNPNGPTLYCIGEAVVGGRLRVFHRWLHMLGGQTNFASALPSLDSPTQRQFFESLAEIHRALAATEVGGMLHTFPAFITMNHGEDSVAEIMQFAVKSGPLANADWGKELASRRTFGANYFARAGSELRQYYDAEPDKDRPYMKMVLARYGHIEDFKHPVIPDYTSTAMTDELFAEWWSMVANRELARECLGQLVSMWEGALSMIDQSHFERIVTVDEVANWLGDFGFSFEENFARGH